MTLKTREDGFLDIIPCKYAGDPTDKVCKTCDGQVLILDGQKHSAQECQSFEEQEETVETPAPPTEEAVAAPEEFQPRGVTVSIKAESGISAELNDDAGRSQWYKFLYTEERTVPPDCDLKLETQALWNDVNRIVDEQLEDTKRYLGEMVG